MKTVLTGILLASLAIVASGTETSTMPTRLQVGVVQMALGQTIADNRDRIVSGITSNFNPQMDAWYRLGAAMGHVQRARETGRWRVALAVRRSSAPW